MKPQRFAAKARAQSGQTLVLFVFFIIVLLLFVGLAVDLGFAYVTKAQLAKALDAAALTGARNIGDAQVNSIVRSTFAMNYGRPGRDTAAVTPTVQIVTVGTQRRLQVAATTTINTFFIRILPNWRTLTVAANAEAIRNRVVMSIILDKSGSMIYNGGCAALPWSTDAFVNLFDDNVDKAALVTFATVPNTPITMRRPFKAPISTAAHSISCDGSTFMQGGLQQGYDQILTEPVAAGDSVLRVAVFFTDGLANTVQETLTCPTSRLMNFGGNAPTEGTTIAFSDPTTGATLCSGNGSTPDTPVNPTGCGCSATTFRAADGSMKTFTRRNISTEAQNRTLTLANQMRSAGIVVYTIGLGSNVDRPFLRNLANSPDAPNYNNGQPSGIAVFPATAAQITGAFQTIASDILGRLTQ
jgi:Flp pilus assembly protein TadG